MTSKSDKKNLVVKNGGEFIMLFPQGTAFLYPGAEVLITDPVSSEQIKRWEKMGCFVSEVTQEEADKLSNGILGLK